MDYFITTENLAEETAQASEAPTELDPSGPDLSKLTSPEAGALGKFTRLDELGKKLKSLDKGTEEISDSESSRVEVVAELKKVPLSKSENEAYQKLFNLLKSDDPNALANALNNSESREFLGKAKDGFTKEGVEGKLTEPEKKFAEFDTALQARRLELKEGQDLISKHLGGEINLSDASFESLQVATNTLEEAIENADDNLKASQRFLEKLKKYRQGLF